MTTTTTTRSVTPIDVFAGAQLRKRRLELKMTQEALAEAIGVSFQQVQKYENGNNRLSASRLHQFSKVLGVAHAYFFPEGDIEILDLPQVDPLTALAKGIYEGARKRVRGRPAWDDLDSEDEWDAAMINLALDLARADLAATARTAA